MKYLDLDADKKTCLDIFHMSVTSIAFCVRAWNDRSGDTRYEECVLFNDLSNLIAPACCWKLALKAGVISASSDIVNGTLYSVDVHDACGDTAATWGQGCMSRAIKELLISHSNVPEHENIHWDLKRKHHLLNNNILKRHLQ